MLACSVDKHFRWWVTAAAALVLAGIAVVISAHVFHHGRLWGLTRLFDLNSEGNIPSWFSSMSLLILAMLLWDIGSRSPEAGPLRTSRWRILSAVFVFFSIDESAQVHELCSRVLRGLLHTDGVLYYVWVLPAFIGVLALGVWYLPFWIALPARTRARVACAVVVYVGGALGIELIGGIYATGGMRNSSVYAAWTIVEETLELTGMLLLLRALADHGVRLPDTTEVPSIPRR